MDIELLSQHPDGATQSPPLLFVHGAWHGAWCWQEHFLPYFAEHGYDAYALSLRGHADSACDKPLRWVRICDYVADLVQTVNTLSRLPVLIGHSMGGTIVQKYLEEHPAAGAVLLASNPPSGVIGTTLRIALRFPLAFLKANLTLSLYPIIATPERAKALLFSSEVSDRALESFHQRLQDESFLAFLDMLILNLPTAREHQVPGLVLGSKSDAVISPTAVQATGRALGTEAVLLSGLGHDMMLEPQWRQAADHILDWLRQKDL